MREPERRPSATAVLAALLFTTTLVAVEDLARPTAQAAPGFVVTTSQGRPLAGESVKIAGTIKPAARPVELHKRSGSRWTTVAKGKTDGSARFALAVKVTGTRSEYRVVAPAAKVGRKSYAAKTSNVVALKAVTPTARISLAPAPVAQSRAGAVDLTPGTATFSPVRAGAPVVIERRTTNGWSTVTKGAQDATGRFDFVVASGPRTAPYTFRGRTTPLKGTTVSTAGGRSAAWRTAWSDEFNDGLLGPNWVIRPAGGPGTARACAMTSVTQTTVSGGSANLAVLPNGLGLAGACPHGQYLNAMVGTQYFHAFTYGVIAARVRFQAERGMHGSIWMQHGGLKLGKTPPGGNDDGGPLPAESVPDLPTVPASVRIADMAARGTAANVASACRGLPAARNGDPQGKGAEIDIVEYFGDGYYKGGISNNIYWAGKDAAGNAGLNRCGALAGNVPGILGPGVSPSNSYHVYSVEWTPTQYIFRTDGYETFRASVGVSGVPEYLIMSLLTSDWELPNMKKDRPSLMSVDWVRVWQK